jgi:hypothetical protein
LISYEELTHVDPACGFTRGGRAIFDLKKMECRCFMGSQLAQADPAKLASCVFFEIAGSLTSPGS